MFLNFFKFRPEGGTVLELILSSEGGTVLELFQVQREERFWNFFKFRGRNGSRTFLSSEGGTVLELF